MQWVKLHTSLHENVDFRRASRQARLLFYVLLELAGKLDRGGVITGRTGPLTVAEIAEKAVLSDKTTLGALVELVGMGYLLHDGKVYEVAKFGEKSAATGPAAERKRRQRERDAQSVTSHGDGHAAEEEVEEETEREERRHAVACPCPEVDPFAAGPDDLGPEAIVDPLLEVFANCHAPSAKDRQRSKWLGWLRDMREQSYTPVEIWAACAKSHGEGRHAPIVQSGGIWAWLRRGRPQRRELRVVEGGSPIPRVGNEAVR